MSGNPERPATFGVSVSPGGSTATPSAVGRSRPAAVLPDVGAFFEGVRRGDRAVLARAISLVESSLPAHEAMARDLLGRLLPHCGGAVRVGITGVPGAGKSTFIERLGTQLTGAGGNVAVLAVDPSSSVSGGSILGDKTRMAALSADPRAFIRPSPSGATLGGVARKTREAILLCEAAGFGVVLVETVGVGQSETAVSLMTDYLIALMIPGAGDELQGIKRGLLERADMIAVNKADGDGRARALAAAQEYAAALRFTRGLSDGVPVLTCSALTGEGIDALWSEAVRALAARRASGELESRRRDQDLAWLHTMLRERLDTLVSESRGAAAALAATEAAIRAGRSTPSAGADAVLAALLHDLRAANKPPGSPMKNQNA